MIICKLRPPRARRSHRYFAVSSFNHACVMGHHLPRAVLVALEYVGRRELRLREGARARGVSSHSDAYSGVKL